MRNRLYIKKEGKNSLCVPDLRSDGGRGEASAALSTLDKRRNPPWLVPQRRRQGRKKGASTTPPAKRLLLRRGDRRGPPPVALKVVNSQGGVAILGSGGEKGEWGSE